MDEITGQAFLDDALQGAPQGQEQAPPAPPPAPTPAPATGGYGPLIAAKEKELRALEDKIKNHRDTGAYIYRASDGQDRFDDVQHRDDSLQVGILDRELRDLHRKQDEGRRLAEQRRGLVNEMARAVFRRESAKVPEDKRRPLAEQFATIFQQVPDSEWTKSIYANRDTVDAALVQLVQTAYGRVSLGGYSGAAPSGFESEEPDTKPKPEDDVDDFTNNVLYALESNKRGSMSVADRRRAEAAKEGGTR